MPRLRMPYNACSELVVYVPCEAPSTGRLLRFSYLDGQDELPRVKRDDPLILCNNDSSVIKKLRHRDSLRVTTSPCIELHRYSLSYPNLGFPLFHRSLYHAYSSCDRLVSFHF